MPSELAATGPHVLRRINGQAVLTALRQAAGGTARVSELAAATGLSRPAVTRALADLGNDGLVGPLDDGPGTGTGTGSGEEGRPGRPARRVRFRSEMGHVAGVDIGPHKVLVLIADLSGEILTTHRATVPPGADAPQLVALVREGLTEAARRAGLEPTDLWAVCAGTPGIVDRERGVVLKAPSIPGWAGPAIVPELREWLGCPVLLDNDATLAVLAELRYGPARETRSMVLVHWGERIGTGIIIDGVPLRGASGAAGELGFLDLFARLDSPTEPVTRVEPSDGSQLPADGMGPFERLVGAAEIRRLAAAAYTDARRAAPPGLTDGRSGLAPLFTAASDGDPVALAVVDRVAARFARGLAVLLLLLDPGHLVIGGGISEAGDILLDPIRRHIEGHTLVPTVIDASQLGGQGVALGAVRLALEAAESRLGLTLQSGQG
ncbi:ROK family transcriptional regulator [Streptomyces sp. SID13666]|uniref:ROK family transcriptional regulator n=1 Tax=unclassified Streptomyces TaxID=2593676 RepID=UPI0013C0C708|nr:MULTISPECIES: ROK family transcriptional regulator [unclassified Streptomyces]NEA53229.1 ROK family transcriptional regulator [Streptomyces sp. SID13666]NEA69444.1 ROK family transcriptional regulator [Streptomyces sp. SID13588]